MPLTEKCQSFLPGGKHSNFIESQLDMFREKCNQFSACTQEMYSAENYHRILAGDNIRLVSICGLMYANGGGNYTTLNKKCSTTERKAIRDIMDDRLHEKLSESSLDETWKKIKKCVTDNKQNGELDTQTVCRKRNETREEKLCGEEIVNTEARKWFNQELEIQHCRCVAIKSLDHDDSDSFGLSEAVKIGIAGGVVVLLFVLILAVVMLYCKHRKTARKLKEHRMRYDATAVSTGRLEDVSTIYQTINDLPMAPKLPNRHMDEGKLLPHGYELNVGPALPDRYVRAKNLPRSGAQARGQPSDEDDRPHSYLEPLPEPRPGPSGLGGPPAGSKAAYSLAETTGEANTAYMLTKHFEDGGYSLAKRIDQSPGNIGSEVPGREGTYFDTLKLTRGRAEDEFGYAKLRGTPGSNNRDTATERDSSTPNYFELEEMSSQQRLSDVTDLTSATKL